ncbi:MAG: transposase [Psychromonas sp.]|jgi:transposase|uniref:hypothetical protein n=1 Tax=Psychromonas sp. TaxID=1884585 RepID=UPI0039E5B0DC
MLEMGDIHRFNKVGSYASYCRCVSGDSYSKTVKSYYQRKLAKNNQTVTIKTVAHKLATACFYVLRDKVPFEAEKSAKNWINLRTK